MKKKPTLAVWKFASCDGCQLSLLDCEDEFIDFVSTVQIANFLEASRAVIKGPYDISLVEGSITTEHDAKRILDIRKNSKYLITIGACANAGGIQALKNYAKLDSFINAVYAHPEYISSLDKSHPISHFIKVDFELNGCPISKSQLVEVVRSFAVGIRPKIPNQSVCVECKAEGHVCVMVAKGVACLGPITHSGCKALCPSFHRGCFSCYGPKENAQTEELVKYLKEKQNLPPEQIERFLSTFYVASPNFEKARKND